MVHPSLRPIPPVWHPTRLAAVSGGAGAPASLEVIHPDGTNEAFPLSAATTDADVPTLLRCLCGLTTTPTVATTPEHASAAWQTPNADGDPVRVVLWPEPEVDFRANGFPRDGGV